MNHDPDVRVGALAVASGYATPAQVDAALMQQSANQDKTLGEILIERKTLSVDQLEGLLAAQALARQDGQGATNSIPSRV